MRIAVGILSILMQWLMSEDIYRPSPPRMLARIRASQFKTVSGGSSLIDVALVSFPKLCYMRLRLMV